jgi:hypothetical protein
LKFAKTGDPHAAHNCANVTVVLRSRCLISGRAHIARKWGMSITLQVLISASHIPPVLVNFVTRLAKKMQTEALYHKSFKISETDA